MNIFGWISSLSAHSFLTSRHGYTQNDEEPLIVCKKINLFFIVLMFTSYVNEKDECTTARSIHHRRYSMSTTTPTDNSSFYKVTVTVLTCKKQ